MIPIQVRVTKELLEKLDKAVESGLYSSRGEAIRDCIRRSVRKKRLSLLQTWNDFLLSKVWRAR